MACHPGSHLGITLGNMLSINVLGGLYVTAGQRPVAGAASQPRRLAALAMLVVAGERGVSREQLRSHLWPDADEERSRHAMTQALYALRRDLGVEEPFLGQQEVRLNRDVIDSDYARFHEALRAKQPERAVELCRGPFLDGFYLPHAEEFGRWAEEQRDAIGHEYTRALEAAAERAAARHDLPGAVGYLKRRAGQDPLNPRVAVRLMEAYAAAGDVAAALQHARVHEQLMRQELQLPVDASVTALVERLRRNPPPPMPLPAAQTPPAAAQLPMAVQTAAASLDADGHAASKVGGRWLGGVAALGVLAVAVAATVVVTRRHPPPSASGEVIVAIGEIADYSGSQPGGLGPALQDMLATNLGRGTGYRVISHARMLELIQQLGGTGDSGPVVSQAARQAGAEELIDGSLYAVAPNRYRLDLRRMDLQHGTMIRSYRVEGPDLFALADSGTASLARELSGIGPIGSLAAASTSSVAAYQAYEEGLATYLEGDIPRAERLLGRALELDSLFPQAAFYYALATSSASQSESMDRLRRAVRLSSRASDRERLIIAAQWQGNNSSPALAAVADTLMVRYPEEVEGYIWAADAADLVGDYARSVTLARRVLAMDSLGVKRAEREPCHICTAYYILAYSYTGMDSIARMHATVREWVRHQPGRAEAWRAMANTYAYEGKEDSARRALRVADSLDPSSVGAQKNRGGLYNLLAILERYRELESLLRADLEERPSDYRTGARWDLAVIFRQQGRLREALPMARAHRMGIPERLLPGAAPYHALLEGQVLLELERYRAAAALFDSIAVGQSGDLEPSARAREHIWAWVHEADALAQVGDTARLRFLADTMERLGRLVAHARDRVLHAHVRGLLARVQGRDEAAASWFRRAITSPVLGYTRTNYELGGAYLRLHRPADAIPILRSATLSGTDGSSLYITLTEVEERLAQAFDSAGQADSAVVYYRRALKAWEDADPQFAARRGAMVKAVERLKG
jgi:DNA-binding SARP family transcriptional activator